VDSTPGFRPSKADNVGSEDKEIKPFAPCHLLGDERYLMKPGMKRVERH
jgi:hypothetical protein